MAKGKTAHGVKRIVSGGQTGVDRAALDVALSLGIEHGGWCPRGRLAEDGTIPARYRLSETASSEYAERTEKNVLDSDGTLILYRGKLTGGTSLTRSLAQWYRKPCITFDLEKRVNVGRAQRWLDENKIRVLNVAGPRESSAPGIHTAAREFLKRLFGDD
jgi:hypothetical protein